MAVGWGWGDVVAIFVSSFLCSVMVHSPDQKKKEKKKGG